MKKALIAILILAGCGSEAPPRKVTDVRCFPDGARVLTYDDGRHWLFLDDHICSLWLIQKSLDKLNQER